LPFLPSQLRAFASVVDHGSLRAAADALGVTPAAVSSSLASLQQVVGVALFERDGRGVKLTAAGTSFAADVRRMLALSSGAIASAKAAAQAPGPPLRIAAVAAACDAFLDDLLARFLAQAPNAPVELEVVRREALWPLIEQRKADIAFAEVPPKHPTLALLAIRRNEYVVAARAGRRYDKAALARSLWFIREPGSGTRATTDEFLREYGISPPARTIGSAAVIIRCVAHGVGVSLLPRDAIADDVRGRRIQVVRTPFTPRPRPWCFIAAADRDVPPLARAFLGVALQSRVFVAAG
jgi:LysR family transcriptional regulator, low CO2-responsive transcriptional regulator